MWELESVNCYADYIENKKGEMSIDSWGAGRSGKNWTKTIDLGKLTVKNPSDVVPDVLKVLNLPFSGFNSTIIDGDEATITGDWKITKDGTSATQEDRQAWKDGKKELWMLEVVIRLNEV